MIHQPWGGVQGQAEDISRHAKEILNMRDKINEILSRHTGQPMDKVQKDTDRDFFMSAAEAKAYGLVDEVITKQK
jgi:ATP-dependent Clp protease protease subunit